MKRLNMNKDNVFKCFVEVNVYVTVFVYTTFEIGKTKQVGLHQIIRQTSLIKLIRTTASHSCFLPFRSVLKVLG